MSIDTWTCGPSGQRRFGSPRCRAALELGRDILDRLNALADSLHFAVEGLRFHGRTEVAFAAEEERESQAALNISDLRQVSTTRRSISICLMFNGGGRHPGLPCRASYLRPEPPMATMWSGPDAFRGDDLERDDTLFDRCGISAFHKTQHYLDELA
jgi:hypothetical protein